jgi:hypothetical protein
LEQKVGDIMCDNERHNNAFIEFAKNNEASTLEQQVIVFPRKYQWVALFASLLFLWWVLCASLFSR